MPSDNAPASASLISTLAPPPQSSRPSSSTSNRSGSSRRGRSPNSSRGSNNLSRSNSDSSRSHNAGNGRKESRDTVTIGGGTSLGPKDGGKVPKNRTPKDDPKKPVDSAAQGRGQNRRSSTNSTRRPDPIHIARPASQTSNPASSHSDQTPQSASAPRSIIASVSAPRTAMDAAVDAATKKHNALSGGDALASLQKMISDLKAISPSSATSAPSSGDSAPGSRTASGSKETPTQAKPTGTRAAASSPVILPGARSKKLKADAPSFTPSLQASVSPVSSQLSISPGSVNAPLWPAQPRSASHGSVRPASSSPTGNGSLSSYGSMPNVANVAVSSLPPYSNASPHFSLASVNAYQSHLHVHPEADNEDLSPLSYAQQSESQYQQQQILAAQQLQYQQLQLLQAQIAATQLSQQHQHQHQQQQSMGSFVAPRFQALAAQRAAQQQQQQAQQLVHAQQLYELQQQQLLEAQRRQEESSRNTAQAVLSNPPAVFEEDSPEPEPKPALLGPTGRPQLAPTFTFGAKARSESDRDATSAPVPSQPLLINRSEGIGGAEAAGLAGLAARAHKRTGSEMSPAMQQQVSDISRSRLIS